MVTFVIPTLWKSEYIYKTIDAIQASNIKEIELIIFDNAKSDFESPDQRISVIKDKNYWVNHAWNKGVELAKNQWVCFLNDDVHINIDLFCREFKRLVIDNDEVRETFGNLAYLSGSKFSEEINEDTDTLTLEPQVTRGSGFGQIIVIDKNNWEPIPEYFRIYFGDDFIYLIQEGMLRKKSWHFGNLKTIGKLSTTSSAVEHVMMEEYELWKQAVDYAYNKYDKH